MTLAAFVLFSARPAVATENFPSAIQNNLELAAPPPCTVCHATNEGGTNTVVKPFGITMRSRGLVPEDEQSLVVALAALQAEGKDSDGDGMPDIEELKAGSDPNGAGTGPGPGGSTETARYGCGAQVSAGRARLDASFLVAGLGAIAAIGLRRRRRSHGKGS